MKLRTVYVRFYRAFNFDYLRKHHSNAKPNPWDLMEDGTFYPYVRLGIDRDMTCIVGANESGKSQLLDAIECALGTQQAGPADFCRYSRYFTVAEAMKLPHFGLHFDGLTSDESKAVAEVIGLSDPTGICSFWMFRTQPGKATLYLDAQGEPHEVDRLEALRTILPSVFRIDPKRALPNSVPIAFLASGGDEGGAEPGPARADRWALVDPVVENAPALLSQVNDPQTFAQTIRNAIGTVHPPSGLSKREASAHRSQLSLAFDLLVTVGGIQVEAFERLKSALRDESDGWANGIRALMNAQVEESLNLAKWWSQDQQFRLALAVRDFDIVFTIRDRTGSEYSFAERSDGLRYFLSYLVQFLAHMKARSGSEILLMDEPDAFLSNQGQQDLLRLLQDFTLQADSVPGGQVVFVTHSPFLIDKNRSDRIRVLDKGAGDEGVRVVRDKGRNHFEPLRTALGGFVGEMAFIGNCNLILEGPADQILLAGMSDLLARKGAATTERLDLNRITLVPAGSASEVRYVTFLARGRDTDKPAVVVLLDGDEEADRAVKALKRDKKLLHPKYIVQLKPDAIAGVGSDRPGGPLDIEDLIPVDIGVAAAKAYGSEVGIEDAGKYPSVECVRRLLSESTGVFKAITMGLEQAGSELRLQKIGFARHALAVCKANEYEQTGEMCSRFAALFAHLTELQREAEREREHESIAARIDREKRRFVRDQLKTATKADVKVLLERIQSALDPSEEADAVAMGMNEIRRDLGLDCGLSEPIADPAGLEVKLERLKYAELQGSQDEEHLIEGDTNAVQPTGTPTTPPPTPAPGALATTAAS